MDYSVFDGVPGAFPKGPTRLERKVKADKDERKEEARWKKEIWTRDQGLCRHTKRKVKRQLELDPLRGECHHVVSRDDRAGRWDRRNGLLLSRASHELVEHNQLKIVGTRFFSINGLAKRYIDCDYPVRFVKA